MSIEVKSIDDRNIEVNGKLLYLDGNGNWVATQELTPQETNAFHRHTYSLKRQQEAKD